MSITVTGEKILIVGKKCLCSGKSPSHSYVATFEDDASTGYFYALEISNGKQNIVNAVYIYSLENIVDGDKPSKVQIGWSQDGWNSVLLINNVPHAVFNLADSSTKCNTV